MEANSVSHGRRPPLWTAILGVAVLSAVLLFAAVLVAAWKNVPLSTLTRDPVATGGLRWHTGVLYKISVMVWGAITVSCLLGATAWRRNGGAKTFRIFLLASAVLTCALALDDMFQLRGELYPDHLGLTEVAVFAIYAVALCASAVLFGSIVRRTEYVVLAAAAALFVLWLGLRHFAVGLVVQDGVKLVGQLTLLLYFFRTSVYGPDVR